MKQLAIGLYLLVTGFLLGFALCQAVYVAPNDAMQGEIFRIIYYHVPSASVAFVFFFLNLVGSVWYLVPREKPPVKFWRAILFCLPVEICIGVLMVIGAFLVAGAAKRVMLNSLTGVGLIWLVLYAGYRLVSWGPARQKEAADALAVASAEVGVVFCTVVLTTGPIWGRRAWGIWWTWDARLTTTLVLWLIYMSYLLLRRFAAGPQMQTLAAVLGIFGALDVPIVYMSNRWWRTQHPAPVFGGAQGSGMDPSMVGALLWNMLAWFSWGVLILALRYHVERQHQKIAAAKVERALAV